MEPPDSGPTTQRSTLLLPQHSYAGSVSLLGIPNPMAHAVPSLSTLKETWTSQLRNEAQQRLGGWKPPLAITQGMDDWDLLKRVSNAPGHHSHAASTAGRGSLLSSPSMKRSVSDNNLESMTNGASGRSSMMMQHHGNHHSQWGWEHPQSPVWPPSFVSTSQYAEAHASAMQAMVSRPIGLLPATEQQHSTDSDEDASGTGAFTDFLGRQPYLRGRHSQPNPKGRNGLEWATALHTGRQGLPRVGTAPTLQELSDTLNTSASRNLEAVQRALLNAQASIQETANNCQQNLATLTSMFQQNLNGSNGPLQAAISNSRAIVTWSISNGGDPLGGALVPWQVFPRVLRTREMEAQGLLTSGGSSSGDVSEGGPGSVNSKGAVFDWVTPLEQYMAQLDANKLKQKRKAGSIKDPGRQVAIVTTASLPWLTGTSVNPLLRAAYLSSDGNRKVTLVLPWLSPADQQRVFPSNVQFDTPEQQEAYVRDWARQRTGLDCNFKVSFYPGRYAAEKGSILPVGDITQVIPDHEADVAVLEEPEHLNWYHHGTRWTDKFNHVVGVMHTNYLDYARREENGHVKELILKHINAWVCRVHCHKVIKLSDAVQHLPREGTMFVHGVSPAFLRVGQAKALAAAEAQGEPVFSRGVYFLGKVLWAKGYTELLDRLKEHTSRTGQQVAVDVYGSGPDLKAVEEEAQRRRLALTFNGARDHADKSIQEYKVFINPSLSDVVATTTAEALAMGKWVVCADHPSNAFFSKFPNCLIYRDSEEFTHCLQRALHEEPRPLSDDQLHTLTWEAATDRFLDVADINSGINPLEAGLDNVLHSVHNTLTGMEFLRVVAGAGSRTRDMPARITDYQPDENDVGGFFDNAARAKRSWEHKQKEAALAKKPAEAPAASSTAAVKA